MLRLVIRERFCGDIVSAAVAHVRKLCADIQLDLVLFPQMDVFLLYLPDAVLFDGLRIVGRIRSKLHRTPNNCACFDMHRVSVFAVHIVRDNHQRTITAQKTDNGVQIVFRINLACVVFQRLTQ